MVGKPEPLPLGLPRLARIPPYRSTANSSRIRQHPVRSRHQQSRPTEGLAPRATLDAICPMSTGTTPGMDAGRNPPPVGGLAPFTPAASPTPTAVPPSTAPHRYPRTAPLPPIGAPTTATTPPIRLPDPLPAQPLRPADGQSTTQVVTYQEIRHSVAAADSFPSLSKAYYGNDSYASALQICGTRPTRVPATLWLVMASSSRATRFTSRQQPCSNAITLPLSPT